MSKLVESNVEQAAIEWLEEDLGYPYQHGSRIARDKKTVVLEADVATFLKSHYPSLPEAVHKGALQGFCYNEGADVHYRNRAFQRKLRKGIDVSWEDSEGQEQAAHLYCINFAQPERNIYRCVNQFSIKGRNDRRPDLILFVNGFPLVVFEFKDMFNSNATVEDAYNQIQHYINDIPQLFEYNAITVLSDGMTTLHGMYSSGMEWFAPWKSVDGRTIIEPSADFSLKSLLFGLFPKDRLLAYIRHFIFHEDHSGKLVKKGAKYHQFFGVRFAVEATQRAIKPVGDGRIGVIWHTQGSGKSISMAIFSGILRQLPQLNNPTIVVQVDRSDLDMQLFENFALAQDLVGKVKHADNVESLRKLLRTDGGGLIFTTIEKFRLDKEKGELKHPSLSKRENIIVIADEAHRTQYGLGTGFAANLRTALPNASFIGFTGTPVDSKGADTEEVFGQLIHTYDIEQAVRDGATVGVFYEPRLAKLHIANDKIDEEVEEITEGLEAKEVRQITWAAVEDAAGAKERVERIAEDILLHHQRRCENLPGKAMIVGMSRRNCVKLYNALTALAHCPEIAVIMTSNIAKDPVEWKTHVRTKAQREAMKARFRDPDDPLKLVIVRDMWLTGFDAPCVHTMYVDKVMQGHSLMQAIARVNRVFRDKPSGVVVDYIGIGTKLKAATKKYTNGGGKGRPTIDTDEVFEDMLIHIKQMKSQLPENLDYSQWRILKDKDKMPLVARSVAHILRNDETSKAFLLDLKRLNAYFTLVKSHKRLSEVGLDILYLQHVGKAVRKVKYPVTQKRKAEQKIKNLISESIESEEIIDVFAMAGLERADISILDENFLLDAKEGKSSSQIKIELLRQLLQNEFQLRKQKNIVKYKKLSEQLEAVIKRYHDNAIDSYTTIAELVNQAQELQATDKREKELGLSAEELAFYDIIHQHKAAMKDSALMKDIVTEVVKAVKANLEFDWYIKEDAVYTIRLAVKRVLRRKVQLSELEAILADIMEQAEGQYRDYVLVA